jgi:aminoglycoside phosphotransferase (APT) family kinase protein
VSQITRGISKTAKKGETSQSGDATRCRNYHWREERSPQNSGNLRSLVFATLLELNTLLNQSCNIITLAHIGNTDMTQWNTLLSSIGGTIEKSSLMFAKRPVSCEVSLYTREKYIARPVYAIPAGCSFASSFPAIYSLIPMLHSNVQSLIPATKLEAVEKALQTAFQTTNVEDIVLLTGGLSTAFVYKITVAGRPYVLRLAMQTDTFRDPARYFACIAIAAEAGIAPAVHYASIEDALSITDFIDAIPLRGHFASADELLTKLAEVVRSLHATPLFPKLIHYLDAIDMLIVQFRSLHILPESATKEHFKYYDEIRRVYPRHDSDMVSSHNDLNPSNLLFDGKKIWVIDWESAFQADRYIDLAIIAKNFVRTQEQEELYLKTYFGKAASEYQQARFFLMQQVTSIFYAMMLMQVAAASLPAGAEHTAEMDTPTLSDFHARLGSGEVSLASYEGQIMYGKVMLNEALRGMTTPRFAESIRILERNPAGI